MILKPKEKDMMALSERRIKENKYPIHGRPFLPTNWIWPLRKVHEDRKYREKNVYPSYK